MVSASSLAPYGFHGWLKVPVARVQKIHLSSSSGSTVKPNALGVRSGKPTCLEIRHGLCVVLLVERPNGWRTEHKGLVQLARVDGRVVAARTLQEILGELHHIEPNHGRRRGLGPDDGRPTRGAAAAVLQRRTREVQSKSHDSLKRQHVPGCGESQRESTAMRAILQRRPPSAVAGSWGVKPGYLFPGRSSVLAVYRIYKRVY